ncbi:MAG: DsrE family protein [Geothrix sp.]|nr:DsrE family protein [Geothrix sp.]
MRGKALLAGLFVPAFLLVLSSSARSLRAAEAKDDKPQHAIHVDVPVTLKKARVVFSLDHLAFSGDMPVGMKYMDLLAKRFKELNTEGDIIGIFYGDAAYLPLNDQAYNAFRHVNTGNPYKGLVADLLKQGVQIEECAFSMKVHHWGNDDLLPGVKVNTGAIGRLIQLVQEGYVQVQP